MLIDLRGRTALVTGSAQGIGRAIAASWLTLARVAINGRSAESVDAVVAELLAEAPQRDLVAAPGDVTDEAGTDAILSAIGHLDVLVSTLGIFGVEPALDITDDEWRRYFVVNVLAAVRLIRATLPGMKERGWGGCSTSRATRRSSSRPR